MLVRPGASVPADGIVQSGKSDVNESMITGESVPVAKTEGAKVIAGTVNGSGSLRVKVTGTGERTALANIMRLVEQAQTSRSRAQALADRAAFVLTIVAVVTGALTLVVWLALGATGAFAVERLVSVLVIACPHALGLAVPLVAAISTSLGAQSGLLVRDRRGLEEARNLTTVVFDKTGTLTRGEFRVVDVATDGSLSGTTRFALRRRSNAIPNTIAQGIVKSAEEQKLSVPKAEQFEAIPGHGVRAVVEGKEFYMGGPAMLKRLALTPAAAVREAADRAAARGQASVYLLTSKAAVAAFTVADAVRPESREAIQRLHDQGIEVVMLTGDAKAVADAVAADLGIDTVFAEVLPGDKVDKIKELKSSGQTSRDGGRWRERCARVAHRGRRRRDRRGHRRRRRSRRCGPRPERPERRAANHRPQPGKLSEDDAEPLVGRGLQHRRDPVGGRCPGDARDSPAACVRRSADVGQHGHRRAQRATLTTRPTVDNSLRCISL